MAWLLQTTICEITCFATTRVGLVCLLYGSFTSILNPSVFHRYNNLKLEFPRATDQTLNLVSGLLTYNPKVRTNVKQSPAAPLFCRITTTVRPIATANIPRDSQSNVREGKVCMPGARDGLAKELTLVFF